MLSVTLTPFSRKCSTRNTVAQTIIVRTFTLVSTNCICYWINAIGTVGAIIWTWRFFKLTFVAEIILITVTNTTFIITMIITLFRTNNTISHTFEITLFGFTYRNAHAKVKKLDFVRAESLVKWTDLNNSLYCQCIFITLGSDFNFTFDFNFIFIITNCFWMY